jgi:hypothetical protein
LNFLAFSLSDQVAIDGVKLGDELNLQVVDAMIPLDSAHGTRRRASRLPPDASRRW